MDMIFKVVSKKSWISNVCVSFTVVICVFIRYFPLGKFLKVALQPYRKIMINNKMMRYGNYFSHKRRDDTYDIWMALIHLHAMPELVEEKI